MRAVPNSRLILLCPLGETRKRVLSLFESHSIPADRVEFAGRCPWKEYLGLMQRIDIALDPFPCNGVTITCHALWMGVPVISLAGDTPVSRSGLSLLSTVGLESLVAHTIDEYLHIAADLSRDLPRLSQLRSTMRDRMNESPLLDAPRFARSMEALYRSAWKEWCASQSQSQ